MNLAELRAFHAVATERGFTAGARSLGLAQPTISAHVKSLEETYGVQLFDRKGRVVQLTEIGRALLEVTRPLFALELAAEELLDTARDLGAGQLVIGTDGPRPVVPVVGELTRRHGGLDVSIVTGNANRILHELLAHRIDVAVVAQEPDDGRIYTMARRCGELVALVAQSHALASKSVVTLAELCEQRLVLREPASVTHQTIHAAMDEAGLQPRAVLQVDNWEGVLESVAEGVGVGIVPEAAIGDDDRNVALRIVDARLQLTEHWLCLQERRRLRVVKAFLDVVGELAAREHWDV